MKKILLASATTTAILVGMTTPQAHAQSAPTPLVQPFHGNISPFHGNISPFYGNISPFHGNISPFYGNIAPFWGNISPFHGNIAPFWGNISPFHGNISPFWGNIAPFWGNISPFVEQIQTSWSALPTTGVAGQTAVRDQLRDLIARSESFWGASVTSQTGQTFWNGFASRIFAKYGIDLNRPETLANVSAADRARFMFDWYDGLMQFSGRDQADHWMATVRWNPAITQQQGMGTDTTIGLIDMSISARATDLTDNVVRWDGNSNVLNSHGGAVASLMVGAHDGRGVMGIAPNASVALFNPFDSTGTTNWQTVARGVVSVTNARASVVNLSLGIPNWVVHPDFRMVYTNTAVQPVLERTVFVQAAGNEGVTQTQNVEWDFNDYPHLLLVGSVGPSGQISTFSNRPGTACFTRKNRCVEPLMDRFLVAPGEWILVNDGAGGVTRQSGTSFAAPIVSGAIALMHDRWPWLKSEPEAVTSILLETARDLGAPGTDPVYGRGLLDITASQSPLDFEDLYYYAVDSKLSLRKVKIETKKNADGAVRRTWDVGTTYLVAYEDKDDSFRDFLIPLQDGLVSATVEGRTEAMQYFLQDAFNRWVNGSGFAQDVRFGQPGGWSLSLAASPLAEGQKARASGLPYGVDVKAESGDGLRLSFGHGDGAVALSGGYALQSASVGAQTGGVNPLFGLASGGAYVGAAQKIGGVELGFGFSARKSHNTIADPVSGEERPIYANLDPYQARAAQVSVTQKLSPDVALTMAYSFLNERAGILGVQSLREGDFTQATNTDAMTMGVSWAPAPKLTLTASATLGKTRAHDAGAQSLTVAGDGVTSSAYEAALNVNGVATRKDTLRLRIAQPMRVEQGQLDHTSVQVVNRTTGELGIVTQRVDLNGGDRRLIVEGMYAAPFLNGMGEIAAFARMDAAAPDAPDTDNVVGASMKLRF